MSSPTQRTLAHLKKLGFDAAVVERWNPYAKIRQDMFGFVDITAFGQEEFGSEFKFKLPLALLIQATSGTNHAARKEKIEANAVADRISRNGSAYVEVWSWAKKGARGKRKLWSLRRERLMPHELSGERWVEVT